MILGRNGLGKSNLFEAIALVFRHLERGEATPFGYEITYRCWDRLIHVVCDPSANRKQISIEVDGQMWRPPAASDGDPDRDRYFDILPRYIFAYYSGWSRRLRDVFEPPLRRHYRALIDQRAFQTPRFFYCRKEYSQLALLTLLGFDDDPTFRATLEGELRIRAFESALCVLQKPDWVKERARRHGREGDPRFWNADVSKLDLLDRMWKAALAPLHLANEEFDLPVPRTREQRSRLYLYFPNRASLGATRDPAESVARYFGQLAALYVCQFLHEVRITVERTDGAVVRFTELSEGEQQLLTVLGLLRFTRDDEALFLLDEPDTHLNPVWTYDFLRHIEQSVPENRNQLIISTHNPLMISGLTRERVRILRTVDNSVRADAPEDDPVGQGVDGLLKSELFGLPSVLAQSVVKKIDRHYELLGIAPRSESEDKELRALGDELARLGVNLTFDNPYYERFAMAMRRRYPPPTAPQTREELDAQADLADELLVEILSERETMEVDR